MKKFRKTLIPLVFLFVASIFGLNYIYFKLTPRMLGDVPFPLTKKWSVCVDERIRNVAIDEMGKILVKTNSTLIAYNQNTGALLWKHKLNIQTRFPPKLVGEKTFFSDNRNLWAFDLKTGKMIWNRALENTDTWVPDASEKFVLLNSISEYVVVYNAETGEKLWQVRGGRGYTQAFIDVDKVYIVDHGIQAYEAISGKLLWKINSEITSDLSVFSDNVLYYMEYIDNTTIDLVAYSTKKKKELWRLNFNDNNPPNTSPSSLFIQNKKIYFSINSGIYQIDADDGEVVWKKSLNFPTEVSFIGDKIYVLSPPKLIHVLDPNNGNTLGDLQISAYPFSLAVEKQMMFSDKTNLVFATGCEVFVYGK